MIRINRQYGQANPIGHTFHVARLQIIRNAPYREEAGAVYGVGTSVGMTINLGETGVNITDVVVNTSQSSTYEIEVFYR